MVKHFLLDTRSTFQKIKDWVSALFKKTPQQEKKRLLSSTEIQNRRNIFTSNIGIPIVPNRGRSADFLRTYRKKHFFQSPLGTIVGRKNC